MRQTLTSILAAGAVFLLAVPALGHDPCPTEPDTFLNGGKPTTDNWHNGGNNSPAPSAGISNGQGYMKIVTPNSPHIAAFNTSQWACDYQASGITSIRADLHNTGSADLTVRMVFCEGGDCRGGGTPLFVSAGVPVAAGASAKGAEFKIDNSKLASVNKVYFRHATGGGGHATSVSNATLLVANVTPVK